MAQLLDEPVIRLFLLPLAAVIVLATVIRLAGGPGAGRGGAGAAIAVTFLWITGVTLGIPDIVPPANGGAIAHVALAGLVIGIIADLFGGGDARARRSRSAIAAPGALVAAVWVVFAAAAVWWLTGGPGGAPEDTWPIGARAAVAAGWLVVLFRVRHLAPGALAPTVMMGMAAAGLGIAASLAGLAADRDLAFALASAFLGFFAWSWLTAAPGLGSAAVLGGGGALLTLAFRVLDGGGMTVLSLIVLGFVFFADSAAGRFRRSQSGAGNLAFALAVAVLSLLPIALALALTAALGG